MSENWKDMVARIDMPAFQADMDALTKKYRNRDHSDAKAYLDNKIEKRDFYREEGKRLVGSFNPMEFWRGVTYLWKGNMTDFSLYHMYVHGAYKNILEGDLETLMPNDREQFKTTHNLRHHRYTNISDIDSDYKIFKKYIRAHKDIKWKPLHLFQCLELFISIIFFRVSFPLHYSNVPDHGYKGQEGLDPLTFISPDVEKRSVIEDIKIASAGVPKWFNSEYWQPVTKSPLRSINTLLGLIISDLITNVLQYVILAPAHHHEEVYSFENHEKPEGRGEWYLHQFLTGCSFTDCDEFFNTMLPDFVYHTAHHLFPGTPEYYYEPMMKEAWDICRKYDIPCFELELRKVSLSHFKDLVVYSFPVANGKHEAKAA